MSERASLEEVLEFANKVREAGGGNPLDALMPAVPTNSSQCLIAKNLNFNCRVSGGDAVYDGGVEVDPSLWEMTVEDKSVRDKIAASLGLQAVDKTCSGETRYGVILPREIGRVAAEFDNTFDEYIGTVTSTAESEFWGEYGFYPGEAALCEEQRDFLREAQRRALTKLSPNERKNIADFLPYIECASEEARSLATLVTPEGQIVL